MIKLVKFFIFLLLLLSLSNCGLYKKVDKQVPIQGEDRARKNINEGRGISLKNLRGGSTTYEFSSSNPLWRATLETLDFLPLLTVDYSGGIVITDWYSQASTSNEYIKITIRFLSNEISAANLKIIVHQKKCVKDDCSITILNSLIKEELSRTILKKAALFEAQNKAEKK